MVVLAACCFEAAAAEQMCGERIQFHSREKPRLRHWKEEEEGGGRRKAFVPSRLGDDHLRADVMEALPQVRALQLHLDLLHGGGGRRLAGARRQVVRCAEGARRPLGEAFAVRAGTGLRVCGWRWGWGRDGRMKMMWKQGAGIKGSAPTRGGKLGSDAAVAPNHLPRHVWWSKVGPRLHGCFLRGGLGLCQN